MVENTLRAPAGTRWGFNERGTLTCQSGSGNNWARGYHTYGPKYRDRVCELLRREASYFSGWFRGAVCRGAVNSRSFLGCAGGGVRPTQQRLVSAKHGWRHRRRLWLIRCGDREARLLDCRDGKPAHSSSAPHSPALLVRLRDEYPHACVLSHCVWPYESGEVIVQNYNTLLTLDVLLQAVDGVFLVQNEALHAAATRLMNIARPTFDDLNRLAARSLAAAMLPAHWRPGSGGAVNRAPGAYLAATANALASTPSLRLITLLSVPVIPERSVDFTTFTWPALLKRLRQMLLTGSTLDEGIDWNVAPGAPGATTCAGAVLTLRGKVRAMPPRGGVDTAPEPRACVGQCTQDAATADVSVVQERRLYTPWVPQPLSVACSPAPFSRCDMAASLVATVSSAATPAARMLDRAYAMYATRAYCHQYRAHGMEDAHFDAAFAHVEDVVAAYAAL